jgi:hypothetical protein
MIWTLCMFMDFPRGCYCVTFQAMQPWKTWSFLIGKGGIFTNVYGKLLPQCAGFKNDSSWASWTLKMEAANCSERSTTILPCVWSHIPEDFIACQNLSQNVKMPNVKFLILHGIGSWNYRFLHYGHNSMHHHTDWKKTHVTKYLKTWITYWTYR